MSNVYINNSPKVEIAQIEKIIQSVSVGPPTKEELKLALSFIDLTSLEGKDTNASIQLLVQKAMDKKVAAICVYPSLVKVAKTESGNSPIYIASVAGAFPSGQLPLHLRLEEAKYAIEQGADEIDMVISRGKFLEGDYTFVFNEIFEFKKICGNKKLKAILETGELGSLDNVRLASDIAIQAGADFIKTSTGKINVNATLPAVCVMLHAIKSHYDSTGKKVGIKPSGGISDGQSAVMYLRLTESILGNEWIQPDLFRFGASRLLDNLLNEIEGIVLKKGDANHEY